MVPWSQLGIAGLLVVLAVFGRWFWRAYRVNIPASPRLFQIGAIIGGGLGLFVLVSGVESTPAGWAVGLCVLFLYLSLTSAQRVGDGVIRVGDVVPDFSAPDHRGATFDGTSLRGSWVLLKFFRGHW